MFMRSWPLLRKYYWQQAELDKAKADAERLAKALEQK
jgi:hypothetical protein